MSIDCLTTKKELFLSSIKKFFHVFSFPSSAMTARPAKSTRPPSVILIFKSPPRVEHWRAKGDENDQKEKYH